MNQLTDREKLIVAYGIVSSLYPGAATTPKELFDLSVKLGVSDEVERLVKIASDDCHKRLNDLLINRS